MPGRRNGTCKGRGVGGAVARVEKARGSEQGMKSERERESLHTTLQSM